MPEMFENFGLDFIKEDRNSWSGFLGYLAEKGRRVEGYSGCPSVFCTMGDIDFYIHTQKNGDRYEFCSIDTHCSGNSVWEMKFTGIDITDKDSCPAGRAFMFKNCKDGSGTLPVNLVNADLLPSYFENDVVKMQMCALPLQINYYENEEMYKKSQHKILNRKKYIPEIGVLFPAGFMQNHTIGGKKDKNSGLGDDVVLFAAKVKSVYYGVFDFEQKKLNTFVRCIAETNYGDIVFAHTFDRVPKTQRSLIKRGSVIYGYCILSGDAAIYDYENGIVKNFDNDFRLVRHVMEKGQAERLRPVLTDNSVYDSYSSCMLYTGAQAITERLQSISDNMKNRCFAFPATISSRSDSNLEYGRGTRCIVLAYNEKDNFESIVFIDVSEEGNIERIKISNDSRYLFYLDEEDNPFYDMKIPPALSEAIINRAKRLNLIKSDCDEKEVFSDADNYDIWQDNAARMLKILKINFAGYDEEILKNVFGYLFAKAVEYSYNSVYNTDSTGLTASYSPSDAADGCISSTFLGERQRRLEECMEKGRQFYTDFKLFYTGKESDEELFNNTLEISLTIVQQIGSFISENVLNTDM